MNTPKFDKDEKPLDPEAEKVSRKLAKFGAMFMGFNMLALMAVLAALVYKLGGYGSEKGEVSEPSKLDFAEPVEFDRNLDLPKGSQIINASKSGNQILLNLKLANGAGAIWIYDISAERITGKLSIR